MFPWQISLQKCLENYGIVENFLTKTPIISFFQPLENENLKPLFVFFRFVVQAMVTRGFTNGKVISGGFLVTCKSSQKQSSLLCLYLLLQ